MKQQISARCPRRMPAQLQTGSQLPRMFSVFDTEQSGHLRISKLHPSPLVVHPCPRVPKSVQYQPSYATLAIMP
jgi:hypothetical protein